GDLLERDGAAGPRLILDQEALPEILAHGTGENPRQHIGAAAGRKRHHQLDDPVGVWLGEGTGRSAYQRRQNNKECRGFHGSPASLAPGERSGGHPLTFEARAEPCLRPKTTRSIRAAPTP